ncbi:B3/4 domain-containing protein [Pyrodictium abyssi]|uniref:B3/B4 domain-containing protein n=1 Tax=Pyrodictium abyssi TaxID=54256 RepID=UPI0030C66B5F
MAVACKDLCSSLSGLVAVDEPAQGLGIRVAYSLAWGRPVEELDAGVLRGEEERLLRELREGYSLETLRGDPVVRAYRDFYWRIGIDPTKTRPSSEALVRRALRGRWPRVNPVVDAGNIASARYMVPIGLYDAERFRPPARITLARGGELFNPIGGNPERLGEGTPIMVDAGGVVMHLYPHRDSRETMVRPETRCILILAAGVPGVEQQRLEAAVREVQRLLGLLGWQSCPETAHAP